MNIQTKGRQLRKILEDLCFPPRCAVCDGILEPGETGVHPECRKKLRPVEEPCCMHCGKPVSLETHEYCPDCAKKLRVSTRPLPGQRSSAPEETITQGKALYLYQGEIKQSMYRLKYANRREYGAFFAE